ncbi:hypothetical protein AOQ84DRAFT_422676 [Glonium stellatum]|uniref:Uncharacterized protein n=1 Tax=Glonium stellatum TaxID=574774 RepID=A0A8E2JMF9_9PEZI|nr:hypothetical protein AOQ84DRAFT_422676 [Glonium stellatum]
MVLDAFTALRLAGNIIQFIDFGSKLIVDTYKTYKSTAGTSEELEHVEQVTASLNGLSYRLTLEISSNSSLNSATHEWKLVELAKKCKKKCGFHSKWESLQQAYRSLMKERRIWELRNRLSDYRNELSIQLVSMLKYGTTYQRCLTIFLIHHIW